MLLFQLRYLQTLNSISAEHNSTIIFPVPIGGTMEITVLMIILLIMMLMPIGGTIKSTVQIIIIFC